MAATDKQAHQTAAPLSPTVFDKVLAAGSALLLVMVLTALCRGQSQWSGVGPAIWLHLGSVIVALALTPIMLLRKRGDRLHRSLGWMWSIALAGTAAVSFFVHTINPGGFSLIHLLSIFTLVQVPIIIMTARRHRIVAHRAAVRGMVLGALLIAGGFTFPFGRMLGRWLFG